MTPAMAAGSGGWGGGVAGRLVGSVLWEGGPPSGWDYRGLGSAMRQSWRALAGQTASVKLVRFLGSSLFMYA